MREDQAMTDMVEFIRRIELFAGVDQRTVERIAERFSELTFKKGEVLCREGELGDRVFVITSGKVIVQKETGWGMRELQELEVGEVVGEMALISNARRSATVIAAEATTCLQMSRTEFTDLLNTEPRFAQRCALILSERLSQLHRSTGEEILNSYRALTFSLANLADSRDPETGAHLARTRKYCALLAESLSKTPKYKDVVDQAFVESIYQVSPLHDIGKVAIPDSILLKPGKLTDDEYEIMKTHTTIGAQSLKDVLQYSNQEIFRMAYRICLNHHERWDGTGYPQGLAGEEIPLEARIMMLADVYDALLSKRVYKPALSPEAVRKEIADQSGAFFDPDLASLMLANIGQFEAVFNQYSS